MSIDIFSDDWRECLVAHYQYVLRHNERVTQRSLERVMRELGFSENELAELRVLATMHVDDVPDDFVPDPVVLEQIEQQVKAEEEALAVKDVSAEEGEIPEPEEKPVRKDDTPTQQRLF